MYEHVAYDAVSSYLQNKFHGSSLSSKYNMISFSFKRIIKSLWGVKIYYEESSLSSSEIIFEKQGLLSFCCFKNCWKVEYNGYPGLGILDDDGWETMFSAISKIFPCCIRGYDPLPLPPILG